MFSENVNCNSLLSNKVTKDSYILYKGKMVSSNLIDIEVIFNKQQTVRRKMMVDTQDDMRILDSRICEVCDLFPKLSGLNGLSAYNFKKKMENGKQELRKIGMIGDWIKANDEIYFDLHFYEIWLDIEMILECDSKSYQIKFELKVVLNSDRKEFEKTLISLGIKSWANIVSNDYYAFSSLEVNYPNTVIQGGSSTSITLQSPRSLITPMNYVNPSHECYNEDIVSFDYDSKLSCRLIFSNMTDIVYQSLNSNTQMKTSSMDFFRDNQREKDIKEYFNNDYFIGWLSSKQDYIAVNDHIIWRYQQSQEENLLFDEDDNNSFNTFSSQDDLSFNVDRGFRHSNRIKIEPLLLPGNTVQMSSFNKKNERHRIDNHHTTVGRKTSNSSVYQKYRKDIHFLKTSVDYCGLVNKYAMNYISLKEFDNMSHDTKNLVELCNGIKESFDIEINERLLSGQRDWEDQLKGLNYWRWLKKWYKRIIGIIIILCIIVVIWYELRL